ncbi:MAG: hypothetical protein SGILL_005970 [Bacillariaceae sp.]
MGVCEEFVPDVMDYIQQRQDEGSNAEAAEYLLISAATNGLTADALATIRRVRLLQCEHYNKAKNNASFRASKKKRKLLSFACDYAEEAEAEGDHSDDVPVPKKVKLRKENAQLKSLLQLRERQVESRDNRVNDLQNEVSQLKKALKEMEKANAFLEIQNQMLMPAPSA